MPYGYIPSPFGGKPSSLDIAKAAKRDRVKDAYVRGARKTPMSRAELERTEKPTGLDYLGLTDSTELTNDRMYRDKNLLSDVNLASNTPKMREMKQDRANPNVQSVEDSRHADFDQVESLDKSENNPSEERNASRTPVGRARAVEGIKSNLSDASPDKSRLMTRDEFGDTWDTDKGQYRSEKMGRARGVLNPDKAKVSPGYREEKQSRSGSPDRSGLEPIPGSDWELGDEHDTYEGIPHMQKSKDNPDEERNAMRTPQGRARAVSREVVYPKTEYRPEALELSQRTRAYTDDDVDIAYDAFRNAWDSYDAGEWRQQKTGNPNPTRAGVTPEERASNVDNANSNLEYGRSNPPANMFEEGIYKSEGESIDKSKGSPFEEYDAMRTPHGRARAASVGGKKGEMPYYSKNNRSFTQDDIAREEDALENTGESWGISHKRGKGDNPVFAERTPQGRARVQYGDSDRGSEYERDERGQLEDVVGFEHIHKSEDESIGKVEGWVEPDEYKALRTPVGRDMAIARAKNPELDGVSVYAGLSGDELRTRGMSDDLDVNEDLAPPSPEEYEYTGVVHAYKSESAPIHKSIQTPVRELIKKRREWR